MLPKIVSVGFPCSGFHTLGSHLHYTTNSDGAVNQGISHPPSGRHKFEQNTDLTGHQRWAHDRDRTSQSPFKKSDVQSWAREGLNPKSLGRHGDHLSSHTKKIYGREESKAMIREFKPYQGLGDGYTIASWTHFPGRWDKRPLSV